MRVGHDIPERLQFGAGMAIMGSVFAVAQALIFLERIGDAVVHASYEAFSFRGGSEARSA